MKRAIIGALTCLVLTITAPVQAQFNAPDAEALTRSERAFELYPGVVVAPDGDAVYLMSPEGGIEKISLASGQVIWSSAEAAKPLALYGDLLIAQADSAYGDENGNLEIVLLDTLAGGQRRADLPIDLPEGALASVDQSLGHSFFVSAVVSAGEPLIAWRQTKRYAGGATPPPDMPLYQKQDAGYRLDFTTGQATELADSAIVVAKPLLPANVQSWENSNEASIPLVQPGDELLATTQANGEGDSESITLKRWDAASGEALSDVELFTGPSILQFASADGRHVLVSERAHPGEFNEYDWLIFSLETGEESGRVSHHRSRSWFYVNGDVLLYVELPFGLRVGQEWQENELRVKAVLLGSGATLWQRPLRDTTFYGPFPQ